MILRSIQLENFGLYAGRTEIDLVPRRRRGVEHPIILIGGNNGAGKTTLLEAVRLALYGRRSLGVRTAQSDYEQYLRERVHRGPDIHGAAVGLEFDYAEAGVLHRFRVRRHWSIRNKGVVEGLILDKDGAVMTSVPREEWHHFLQELIPPGVSQLFFFDGEKIREIADEDDDNEQLAEAVRGLLGIELVGNLRTDIGLFLAKQQRAEEGGVGDRLEKVVRELDVLERQAAMLNEEVAELTSARDSQERAAEQIRRRFVSEGGDVAAHRGRIEGERNEVRRQIFEAEREFRTLAGGLLPFALAPKVIVSFRAALARTSNGDRRSASTDLLAAIAVWSKEGTKTSGRQAKWESKHWSDLDRFMQKWSTQKTASTEVPAFRAIGDGAVALARLAEVEGGVRTRAQDLRNELDALVQRSRDLDSTLSRADNAAAGVLLDELRLAEQKVGATEELLRSKQDAHKLARGQVVTLGRERDRFLEEQAREAATANRAALAARAAQVLAEFENRLLQHKLSQLRGEFVDRFNYLARKGNFITDIRIDPATFASTLVDRNGAELAKSTLSAGEKQVYAIAMLWALARTSGRPLPMIIDTPLARLDSEHRFNLVERYFPAASHQVILLSTDTEVDHSLVASLGQSISHMYRLDYDQDRQCTVASEGYFEEAAEKQAGRRALH